MPSDKVHFRYDQIEDIARQAQAKSDAAAQVRQRLNQGIQQLHDGGWVGRGAQAFFSEMDSEILPAVRKLENALEQLGTVLIRSADTMREAEQRAAGLFRAEGGGLNKGGANAGGAGGPSGSGTPFTNAIKNISRAYNLTEAALKKLGKTLPRTGMIGNLISLLGTVTGAYESSNPDALGNGLTSFGIETAIGLHPIGRAVLLINDGNQLLANTISSGASYLNEGVNDARLAESIRNFDNVNKNLDLTNITGSVGALGYDFMQASTLGAQERFNNPTPLRVIQGLIPGGDTIAGIIKDPSILRDMGRNTLMTLGSVGDVVTGALALGPAYVDLAKNSMRVGLQQLGVSTGLSEFASNAFGTVANTVTSLTNPIGSFLQRVGQSVDLTDLVDKFIPAPTR